MKKSLSLVLAAVLALMTCVSALAGTYEDYTVDYKFYRQMRQNDTIAAVTLTAEGERFSLLSDETWAALRALAPAMRLEMQNCMNKKGSGQSSAKLLLNGQEALRLEALYDAATVCLLLPGTDGQWLSAPKDWQWSRLASLQFNDGDVPLLWNLVLEVLAAPKTWQEQAASSAEKYQAELGVWVNGFAASSSGTDENGVLYSELRCTVPAEALKDEMKLLLGQVFADEGLLSLLRRVALPEEAVYLTPAALPYFNSDNCNGDNFYYATREQMEEAVSFWELAYKNRWFARLTILEKESGALIGTMELCYRASEDAFNGMCVLRVDVGSAYEREAVLSELFELVTPHTDAWLGSKGIVTKAPVYAVERVAALKKCGFSPSEHFLLDSRSGYPYSGYWTNAASSV